jgi:hypothetical protein
MDKPLRCHKVSLRRRINIGESKKTNVSWASLLPGGPLLQPSAEQYDNPLLQQSQQFCRQRRNENGDWLITRLALKFGPKMSAPGDEKSRN